MPDAVGRQADYGHGDHRRRHHRCSWRRRNAVDVAEMSTGPGGVRPAGQKFSAPKGAAFRRNLTGSGTRPFGSREGDPPRVALDEAQP